ncbi:MAG: hypothetical protein U1D30_16530 [Planctomycetota bacterium]
MTTRSWKTWIMGIGMGIGAWLAGTDDVQASHSLVGKAAQLQQQTCALVATIEQGFVGAREYHCLVEASRQLERQAAEVACLVRRSCDVCKAERVLDCMENQLDRVEDLIDDTNRCAAPKQVRKQAKALMGQICRSIECLEDAVADCRPGHCPPARGGVVIQPYPTPRPLPPRHVMPARPNWSNGPVTVGFGRIRLRFD